MVSDFYRSVLTVLFLLFLIDLNGQDQTGQQRGKFSLSGKRQAEVSQSGIFDFPELESRPYYRDDRKLSRISDHYQREEFEQAYRLLRAYVNKFAISNFRLDTELLIDLARLSDRFGPDGEALMLWKIIKKHQPSIVDSIMVARAYDSLERDKVRYYVPVSGYASVAALRREIDTMKVAPGTLLNMGDLVNSRFADYAPTMGNVDNLLLFTSKRNLHSTDFNAPADEDLFISRRVDGSWEKAVELRSINTSNNEGSACLSRDGKLLVFSRCNAPGGVGNCDLYTAKLNKDSVWTEIKNLGPDINSIGWDSHPSLTRSGDTLFFASNRKGGFGLSDIYFTVRDKSGSWLPARNAGPVINTRHSEVSPFIHHQSNILYFSSNGFPVTFGDFDIYRASWNGQHWEEPKNLGPLVNGSGSEYYFTMDALSKEIFFSRSEQTGSNTDLFSFPMPMEAQPLAVTRVSGTVTDSTGVPAYGIVSIVDLDAGVEIAPKYLREDGTFDFDLINNRHYLLVVEGDNFFRLEEEFLLQGGLQLDKKVQPFESRIAFSSVEFEPNRAEILPSMETDLEKLGTFLTDHPELRLEISGHTDSAGNADANLKLSRDRAEAIRNHLLDRFSIEPDRIKATGFGSTRPVVQPEVTERDRQVNRRVEFSLTRPD